MRPLYRCFAGLDIHRDTVSVCVRRQVRGQAEAVLEEQVFGTFTQDLERLCGWLKKYHVRHVAMESPGVYWIPIWNVLEKQFELMLVNPATVRALRGNKTDRIDARRIAEYLQHGLAPALRISHRDLVGDLRQTGAGAVSAIHRSKWLSVGTRGMLVAGQISLSLVLLIGAALLMKSFVHVRNIDPGFESSRLLTMKIALPSVAYDSGEKRTAFFRELVRRIRDLPGVVDATAAMSIPTSSGWLGTNVLVQGQPVLDGSQQPTARLQSVTPGYFHTVRIPLRQGRYFTEEDSTSAARAGAVVNESFVRRFWPAYPLGVNPIGQHLREGIDRTGEMEIVGIVGDVHEGGLDSNSGPEFFVPLIVHPPQIAYLAVRTVRDPLSSAPAIRKAVLTIDRNQPVSDIKTMDELLSATLGQRRVTVLLFSAFASVALLLSVVGMYGVIAYSVEQRTQEVCIRTALGAQKGDILRLVVCQGIVLALVGIAIGSIGAFLLTRVMAHLLFNVSATDTVTFLLTPAVFLIVSVLASYIPARRAAKIDPMISLRVA